MKLVIAIVNNDDSMAVSAALTRHKFFVTKLSTTGGFLMIGNTTYLIGAEDDRVDKVKEIVAKYSQQRKHTVTTRDSLGYGFSEGELEKEVTIGGATVFVLNVDSMEKF